MLRPALACVLLSALALSGCSAPGDVRAVNLSGLADQDAYEAAFQAARDELREQGYLIERVDAAAGVISTQRSGSIREAEDLANRQRHYVRVTFSPPAPGGSATSPANPDEVTGEPTMVGERVMLVRVVVERVQRPGWRVPPSSSVRLSSTSVDPDLESRDLRPVYAVAIKEDRALANRLTDAIMRRIGGFAQPR